MWDRDYDAKNVRRRKLDRLRDRLLLLVTYPDTSEPLLLNAATGRFQSATEAELRDAGVWHEPVSVDLICKVDQGHVAHSLAEGRSLDTLTEEDLGLYAIGVWLQALDASRVVHQISRGYAMALPLMRRRVWWAVTRSLWIDLTRLACAAARPVRLLEYLALVTIGPKMVLGREQLRAHVMKERPALPFLLMFGLGTLIARQLEASPGCRAVSFDSEWRDENAAHLYREVILSSGKARYLQQRICSKRSTSKRKTVKQEVP